MAITENERRELGKQGKLWRLEVMWENGPETRRDVRDNLTGNEVMKYRETILSAGWAAFIDPGRFKIVLPMDIVSIEMFKQEKYFDPDPGR